MFVDEDKTVVLDIRVRVHVDPADSGIVEQMRESKGDLSILDIVRAEIESNLESVSYVRHAHAE